MLLDDLLSQTFDVSDALEPARRAALASACQQLDLPPARPSLGAAEAARVDGERHKALRQALSATRELVTSSRFDLQVLAVLMRLAVEVEGVEGVRAALSMLVKLLDQGWGALERGRAEFSGADREKLDRRRGSYLDAVLGQIYFWLARERERGAPDLQQAFARDRDAWLRLIETVDACLERSSAKVSRWVATREALEAFARAPGVESSPALEHAVDAAPGGAAEPAGAAGRAAMREAESRAPAPDASDASSASSMPADAIDVSPAGELASNTRLLEVSARFRELERRLDAFGALLETGQFEKARIVARDLSQVLAAFDVAAYFPGLFAGYFELAARHAQALSPPQPLDSVRGSALSELYRTDLTRFLQLTLEPT